MNIPLIDSEELISMAQAARMVPRRRGNRPTNPATLYRWVNIGLRGIRLEAIQAGGVLCTSREAIQRFFHRLTAQRLSQPTTVSATRARQIEKADREAARLLT